MINWRLQEADLGTLTEQLNVLTESQLQSHAGVFHPLNSNTVVLDYEEISAEELKRRAELFVKYTPGKLFYFSKAENVSLPDGDLKLSKSDQVSFGVALAELEPGRALLTESVFQHLDALTDDALASLVRANLQVGFRPLLVIFGQPDRDRLPLSLLEDASSVFFSSTMLVQCPLIHRAILDFSGLTIDLEWLKLSSWRIQLRNLSIQHDLNAIVHRLKKIVLRGRSKAQSAEPDGVLCLFGGWVLEQLNSQVISLARDGYECLTRGGRMWKFQLCSAESECPSPVEQIELHFAAEKEGDEQTIASISLKEGVKFESCVRKGTEPFISTADYEKKDSLASLIRYFSQGESTSTYLDSYQRGMELSTLALGGQLSLGVDAYGD